jgi:BirA family biotin operon repressor/biotin-[acetyl-CoA-carboxylase] ligase
MHLDSDQLRASLNLPTFEHHCELGSTNDRAIELARDPATLLPLLVVADRQTAGRGRGANRWWSDGGALLFTLAIEPDAFGIAAEHWPLIALVAGLAIAEALEDFAPAAPLALKWPNDVYLGQKKLCGILVEAPNTRPARLAIGVGVNLNNGFDDAPQEIRAKATSLSTESHFTFDATRVLSAIVAQLLARLPAIARDRAALVESWRPRCLLTGRIVSIETPAGPRSGRCQGIDRDGALLLETKCGLQRCLAGVVTQWT